MMELLRIFKAMHTETKSIIEYEEKLKATRTSVTPAALGIKVRPPKRNGESPAETFFNVMNSKASRCSAQAMSLLTFYEVSNA